MGQRLLYAFASLGIAILIGFSVYISLPKVSTPAVDSLSWKDLGTLNYETGDMPSELKNMIGKKVKIPGFMVPLEDDMTKVTQFLLVPTRQACIHVPPPPPNQMVLVNMALPVDYSYGAIWIEGKLEVNTKESIYGKSSFSMTGLQVYPWDGGNL